MKIKTIFIGFSLFMNIIVFAQERVWDWAESFDGPDIEYGNDIAVDNLNNIYVTGTFYGSIAIGDTVLYAYNFDAFLSKLSPEGEVFWTWHFKGYNSSSQVSDCKVVVDSSNNIYVAGKYAHTIQIGDSTFQSLGNWDIFIAKFNENGDLLDVDQIKGPRPDYFNNDLLWQDGLYIGVEHNGLTGLDSYAVYGNSDTIFYDGRCYTVAKFNENLDLLWVDYGSTLSPYFSSKKIVLDPLGNIYTQANFNDSILFGDTVIYPEYYYANIFRKYDLNGNLQWTKQLPNINNRDYVFDDMGNMFCAINISNYDSLVIIDNDTISPINSATDVIFAKYDTNFDNLWYQIINDDYTLVYGLDISENGNILLSGVFRYELNIGDSTFLSNNTQSFVSEFDIDGNFIEAFRTLGGTPSMWKGIHFHDIVEDNCGNIILTGRFNGDAFFGQDTINGDESGNVFIAKYLLSDFKISLGSDTTICGNTLLSPGYSYNSYLWSNGSSLPYIEIDSTGYYWVTVTNENYCEASDTIYVIVKPIPSTYLGQDTLLKFSDTLRLSINSTCDTYLWHDGSSNNYFDVIGSNYDEGLHLFWVTAELDSCFSTDSIWVNIIDDTGIGESLDLGVKVFPNPADDFLIVDVDNPTLKSYRFQLFDIFGHSKINFEFDSRISNSKQISLSNLKAGLYMIKITFKKSVFCKKLVIQK